MFIIEKNIPFPVSERKPPKPRESRFPFGQMEVGDSFLVPLENIKSKNPYMSISQSCYKYSKKSGKKFRARRNGDNFRVWRMA